MPGISSCCKVFEIIFCESLLAFLCMFHCFDFRLKYSLIFEICMLSGVQHSCNQGYCAWKVIRRNKTAVHCGPLHDGLIEDSGRRLCALANKNAGILFQ